MLISAMLSTFLIGIVAAQANPLLDPVKKMFTEWGEGNLSINVAKYLFMALLAIFIFSIAQAMPFLKKMNAGLIGLFALIVAFLSTAYLAPQELYDLLLSYNALGMLLGAIIPLIILVFFSIEMGKEGEGGAIIQKVIWVGFIGFLIYKIYRGLTATGAEMSLSWAGAITYAAIIAVSLIFVVFNRKIMLAFFKSGVKDVKQEMFEHLEKEEVLRDVKSKEYGKWKKKSLK